MDHAFNDFSGVIIYCGGCLRRNFSIAQRVMIYVLYMAADHKSRATPN
jgi:hypothetical protein